MKSATPRIQSIDQAISIYDSIFVACTQPDKSVSGQSLDIYKELADWGWVDKYPISDKNNRWLYATIIAMILDGAFTADSALTTIPVDFFSRKKKREKAKWEIIQNALDKSTTIKKL